MILIPIFLVLFASWTLWGWTVGESRNIKWLRCWCAPIFVATVVLISAGGGAYIARMMTRNAVRADISNLLQAMELRMRTGDVEDVIAELQILNHSDDPDADASDVLEDVVQITDNLSPRSPDMAEGPRPLEMH